MKIEDICPKCGKKEERPRKNNMMCWNCDFGIPTQNPEVYFSVEDWNQLSRQRQLLESMLDDFKRGQYITRNREIEEVLNNG